MINVIMIFGLLIAMTIIVAIAVAIEESIFLKEEKKAMEAEMEFYKAKYPKGVPRVFMYKSDEI